MRIRSAGSRRCSPNEIVLNERGYDRAPIGQNIWRLFGSAMIAALLSVLPASSAVSDSLEACLNDPSCLCYEPLEASDGPFGVDALVNPSDSSVKECGIFFLEGGGDTVATVPRESGLDMPGTGVSRVWEIAQDGTHDSHLGESWSADIGPGESLCFAGYERINFSGLRTEQRARLTRFSTRTGAQSVIQWRFGASPSSLRLTNVMAGADENCPAKSGSDTIFTSDADDSWIRYEHCLDLSSDQALSFRARVRVLDTGKQWETQCEQKGSTSGLEFNAAWPANVFSQNGDPGWKRWKSHVSAWKTTFSPDFWPPPAVEVEGSGGGSSIVPPPPDDTTGAIEDDPIGDVDPVPTEGSGCEQNPAALFCEDFEGQTLNSFQDVNSDGLRIQGAVVNSGVAALEASIPGGGHGEGWASHFFGDHPLRPGGPGSGRDEIVLAGSIRFSSGFDFTRRVKLFNLAAFEAWGAGYPGPLSWSPYYLNIAVDEGGAPFVELHSKTTGASVWRRFEQNLGSPVALQRNRWHRVEVRASLNSLGQNDGVLEMWVDGVKRASYSDVNFRGSYNEHGWNHFMLTPWHQLQAQQSQSIFWDGVGLASERLEQAPGGSAGGLTPPARPLLLP